MRQRAPGDFNRCFNIARLADQPLCRAVPAVQGFMPDPNAMRKTLLQARVI